MKTTSFEAAGDAQPDFEVNPAKRWKLALAGVLFAALLVLIVKGADWASDFNERRQDERIRPTMTALAEQGKPEAVIWMLEHTQSEWPTPARLFFPKLSGLADKGDPEAVVWMLSRNAEYWSKADFEPLRKAAETGHPKSMYFYAQVLAYQGDKTGSQQWVERAAAVGSPEAVLKLSSAGLAR